MFISDIGIKSMDKRIEKNLANAVTFLRIPIGISIPFTKAFGFLFYTLLVLGAFSDAIDGYIARKFNAKSRFGALLDSVADLVFFGCSIFATLRVTEHNLNDTARLMLIAVIIFRSLCYILGYFKFKALASLHTYLNKLTAISIFISILVIPLCGISTPCIITCAIALAAVFEEILIVSLSSVLTSDTPSVFHALKKIERRH